MKTETLLAVVAIIAAPLNASAFGVGDLIGGAKEETPVVAVPSTAGNSVLEQGIGAVAGEGVADVVTGKTNPIVALAAKQLGIPTEYLPQVQALYDAYQGTGSVTEANVTEQAGLSSWLGKQDGMSAGGLASALTTAFGAK